VSQQKILFKKLKWELINAFYVINSFVKYVIMASKMVGTPKMIVPYEWILENVGQEPMMIASKMILFRGAKEYSVWV
jgi:uncharacterized membrane protein YraQ (UPF0718 family)